MIRSRLQAIGMTQRELAKRLNVSEGRISQLLSDTSNPTVRTLARVATVLDCQLRIKIEVPEQIRVWSLAA